MTIDLLFHYLNVSVSNAYSMVSRLFGRLVIDDRDVAYTDLGQPEWENESQVQQVRPFSFLQTRLLNKTNLL